MERIFPPSFSNLDLQIHMASFIGGDRWWEDALGRDWWSRDWKPSFNVLYYIKNGGFSLTIDGRQYRAKAGDMILIPAFSQLHFSMAGEEALDKYYLHFRLLLGKGMLADQYEFERVVHLDQPELAEAIFLRLIDSKDLLGFSEKGALLELLGLFFEKSAPTPKNPDRLGKAIDRIHSHLGEHLSIGALAGLCGYSKDHFTRKFKEAYGRPPCQYITDLKLARAKELLRATDKTVAAIAEELGFGDAGYFTNFFCQKTGLAPSYYRKEERKNEDYGKNQGESLG